jgi:hypothetical protein
MKNILIVFLLAVGVAHAQDSTNVLRSKNGEPVLPEAKDWGLSIDATKFIKNAEFNFMSQAQTIMFKYFKDARTAYRIGVRVGVNEWTTKAMVTDRAAATSTVIAYPAAVPMKRNQWKRTAAIFGLSGGIEKRRGSTRLQGFYGAEAGFYLSAMRDKFTYGNALNASSLNPLYVTEEDELISPVLGNANNVDTVPAIQGVIGNARVIERKSGLAFSIGGRMFIGAEYFFLPKMSIGGEFGWGIGVTTSGRTETTLESIGASNIQGNTTSAVKRTTIDGDQHSTLRIDNDNMNTIGGLSASLRLSLYF